MRVPVRRVNIYCSIEVRSDIIQNALAATPYMSAVMGSGSTSTHLVLHTEPYSTQSGKVSRES
jgi:hypothetical protein